MHCSNWRIEFYTVARGSSPVLEFINDLSEKERAKVYDYLRLLREFGTQLGMPYAKPISGHKPLWELRPKSNRLIYFAYTDRRFIVLHAFPKPRRKIPARHINTANQRMAEFLRRER
jgi:phage-related protein